MSTCTKKRPIFSYARLSRGYGEGVSLSERFAAALQSYVNVAAYEPAVVQLLLVGGVGAVPALAESRYRFRNDLADLWQEPLDEAVENREIPGPKHPPDRRRVGRGL